MINAEFTDAEPPSEEDGMDVYEEAEVAELRIRFMEKVLPRALSERLNTATIVELEDAVRGCRIDMLQDSKLIIAISFGKSDVEPAKTYVISKPEIIQRMSRRPQISSSADIDSLIGDLTYLSREASRRAQIEE